MFGWDAADIPMLISLPALLVVSGFFSGSETVLFGLGEAQRIRLRESRSVGGRAAVALLADPGGLLITVLLANTTVNVAFFVTSSVLLMHTDIGAAGQTAMALAFLLLIVLIGEVLPKALADAHRTRLAPICAPPLLTFHTVVTPLRVGLARGVIRPLARLFSPRAAPGNLDDDELQSLLELYGREGVIDDRERSVLTELIELSRLKVRDVMTPRVRMVALHQDATREDVVAIVREHRCLTIPVYREDLDDIAGVLHAKRYLRDSEITSVMDPRSLAEAHFVPEIATLEQLLEHFRTRQTRAAIVVDEYGGTEGTVSVEDVVEEIVGDIVIGPASSTPEPMLVGIGTWRVTGDWSVHDFDEAFDVDLDDQEYATIGGLVIAALGREAVEGDRTELHGFEFIVEATDRRRIVTVLVRRSSSEEHAS